MDTSRTLFVGPRVPSEWARATSLLKHVDQTLFRALLSLAVKIETTAPTAATAPGAAPGALESGEVNTLAGLRTDKLSMDAIHTLFAGVLTLFRAAVRQPAIKAAILKEDLKELKLSQEFSTDFAKAVESSREAALANAVNNKASLPSLEQLQWRVDVSISTGALSRALRPTILLQLTLSDQTVKQFEVPLAQFHELRYNVALLLKDMDAINQRSVFKIRDQ